MKLEIINKKRLPNHDTINGTRLVATGDAAFDSKYTTLTNRPAIIQQLGNSFFKTVLSEDIESLAVEGKHVTIRTLNRRDIKQIINLLLDLEKNTGKAL